MPKALRWSAKAIAEYQDAIQYLLDEWGESIALKFREHTDRQLERIVNSPQQFQIVSERKKVHRCVVNKHISIFFTVQEESVHVIRFHSNRQDPENLKSLL